jgi:hypothetical protein
MDKKNEKKINYKIFSPNLLPRLAKEDLCFRSTRAGIKKFLLISFFLFLLLWAFGGLILLNMRNNKTKLNNSLSVDKYGDKLVELEKSNSYSRESRVSANKIEKSLEKHYKFSNLLEELTKLTPQGIVLNTLETAIDQPGSIKVSGLAKEREGFLKFKENLDRSSFFEKIDSPLSNYVEPDNFSFQLSLKLKDWKPSWGDTAASTSATKAKTPSEKTDEE